MQSPDHVSATEFACIIHHTWTVPDQTKDTLFRLAYWSRQGTFVTVYAIGIAPYK